MSVRPAFFSALDTLEATYGLRSGLQEDPVLRGRRLAVPMPLVSDYVCDGELVPEERKKQRLLFSPKLRGVNLGGWLVLVPWITPSLFYQFENQPKERTAMDLHSFCRALGPNEGNRQLREHWRKWVTEEDIQRLAAQGINTIRVPVGDWMWEPYEPYTGCTNGSVAELKRVLRYCQRHGIRALVDLHGVRRSQNGFDHSGHSTNISWSDDDHFTHWPIRSAGWQGAFDPVSFKYLAISWDNIRATVTTLQAVALSLRSYPAVLGLEALNEPWQFTPLDVLKAFYWDAYWAVRAAAPQWLFVIHDSFRLEEWSGYMKGCPAVALDTHVSQAWFDIRSQSSFLENACSWRGRLAQVQRSTQMPLLVGEWNLATDNCAMWVNGFHDNAPGFPKVQCAMVPCARPYVSGIAGPPESPDPPTPLGTGGSGPLNGECPTTKPWDNEREIMPLLAQHKLSAFDEAAGWFFSNFKAEMHAQWSYQTAHARSWFPRNLSQSPPQYFNVCATETDGRAAPATSDLPWYNALPSARSSSPVVLLLGLALGTLLGAAVLLKVVLHLLERSHMSRRATPKGSLELPPRLLTLARKTQGRKPDGLGVLGLKQRVSSRTLTQLAFPLMSREHAIAEADEEALDWQSPKSSRIGSPSQQAAEAAFNALHRIREGGSSSSSEGGFGSEGSGGGLGQALAMFFGGGGSGGGSGSSSGDAATREAA